MKLSELRRACVLRLEECGIERPFYVADVIISHVLDIERARLISGYDEEVPPHACEGVFFMIKRRTLREPLSYILGEAEFYGRPFTVGPGCLIPRPETELLVEEMLRITNDYGSFADWCTGSGCIGVTIVLEKPCLRGIGVDSSSAALAYAAANCKRHKVADKFTLLQNSDPSRCSMLPHSLDFIIANPPYIPTDEISALMSDVRDFEPHEALDGGEYGLALYKKFFASFPALLKAGGWLGVETAGNRQCTMLKELAAASPFALKNELYDYNGILRHLIWQKL